ncbi:MAG: hypothetical protein AABY36_00370, partial [Campylobacterota bacterium]
MMNISNLSELGAIIDTACDNSDVEELSTIISSHSEYTETLEDSIEKVYSYYILGNAWSGIRKILHDTNINNIWSFQQDEVFKEIYNFRKAKLQKSFEDSNLEIKIAINVNLANAFSHYGRTINAIKYFNNAIGLKIFNKMVEFHPNFILAKLNRGKALEYYAKLDYDPNHQFIFIQFAYKAFKETKELLVICLSQYNQDENYYKLIEDDVQNTIINYEKQWKVQDLENLDTFKNHASKHSANEKKYRDWCLQNRLFLNSLNDLGNYQITS